MSNKVIHNRYSDFNVAVLMPMYPGDCRKDDWETFLMNIYNLIGVKVKWQYRKMPFDSPYAKPSKELKKVLAEFVKSIYGKANLDYDRMFQFITDEIHNQGVQDPAMVSWLTDQQKDEAVAEWKRNPTDINFIKSIADPYTAQFKYSRPNFDYFMNH